MSRCTRSNRQSRPPELELIESERNPPVGPPTPYTGPPPVFQEPPSWLMALPGPVGPITESINAYFDHDDDDEIVVIGPNTPGYISHPNDYVPPVPDPPGLLSSDPKTATSTFQSLFNQHRSSTTTNGAAGSSSTSTSSRRTRQGGSKTKKEANAVDAETKPKSKRRSKKK